jgi:hypothetical protein
MARQVFCGLLAGPDEGEAWLGEGLTTFLGLNMGNPASIPAKEGRAVDFLEEEIFLHLLDRGFGLYTGAPGTEPEGLCCGAVRPYLHHVNLNSLLGFTCSPFHPAGPATLLGYRTGSMDAAGSAERKLAAVKGEFLEVSDPRALRYSKTEQARRSGWAVLSLVTLQNRMGADTMAAILQDFTARYMHRSPGLDDFLAVVQEKAGGDLASLAEFLFKDQGMVDYAVESARCEAVSEARGYITQHKVSDRIEENCTQPEGEASPVCTPHPWSSLIRFGKARDVESGSPPEGESAAYRWEVIVGNRGDMALPVSVRLTFESGRTEAKLWDGRGGLLHLSGEGADRLVSAEADPDGIYAVDINRLNNGRSVKFNDRGVLFLAGWTQFWIQNYLNGWAFLN